MNTPLNLIAGKLEAGFCYKNPQQLLDAFVAVITAYLPSNFNTFNQGTTPSEQNRDKPWFKVTADVPDRWYWWNATEGKWVAPHPVPPSSAERRIYRGSVESLVTYDGGTAGTVGDAAGPMWEVDSEMSGKFPFGVDTDVTLNRTVFGTAPGTAGAKTVALTSGEMRNHTHTLKPVVAADGLVDVCFQKEAGQNSTMEVAGVDPDNTLRFSTLNTILGLLKTNDASLSDGHNNMPPFIGVYYIKRTARKFYVG